MDDTGATDARIVWPIHQLALTSSCVDAAKPKASAKIDLASKQASVDNDILIFSPNESQNRQSAAGARFGFGRPKAPSSRLLPKHSAKHGLKESKFRVLWCFRQQTAAYVSHNHAKAWSQLLSENRQVEATT